MLIDGLHADRVLAEVPAPSTPLGPFEDGLVAWTTWVTLMGFLGVVVLALVVAGPATRRLGTDVAAAATVRLARVAAVLAILAVPAVLTATAHTASKVGGYDYGTAWQALYDGTGDGLLAGLELTFLAAGVLVMLPLIARPIAYTRGRVWLLSGGIATGAIALATTKFPAKAPADWGRGTFNTTMWMLHLFGGAVWIGGLLGLVALAVPGAIPAGRRGEFWSPAIRRFSVAAMSCVGAITLSGLFLYWAHVDGPTQLFTTMYGRVLGVKILIFGAMLLIGVVNQFWLHPRIEALRAAGDSRPLRTLLVREFPAAIALEVVLGLSVLMVAPFLHGSARGQAFQTEAAKTAPAGTKAKDLPKAPAKMASASTWVYGTAETIAVIVVLAGGYRVSGRIARRRTESTATAEPELVDV